MTVTPVTAAQIGVIVSQPQVTSSWGSRVVAYSFSKPFMKKIAIIVALVLAMALVCTIIDMMMTKDKGNDDNPDDESTPPKDPIKFDSETKKTKRRQTNKSRKIPRPLLPDNLSTKPIQKILSKAERLELIEKIRALDKPIGIKNITTNDCFLISAFQYIFFSNLLDFFLDPNNLIQNAQSETFYRLFVWVAQNYANQTKDLRVDYFRRLIPNATETGMGDPSEAITSFLDFYNDQKRYEKLCQTRCVKKAMIQDKKELKPPTNDFIVFVGLPFPEKCKVCEDKTSKCNHKVSIRDLWDKVHSSIVIEDEANALLMSNGTKISPWTESSSIVLQMPGLHLQPQRFEPKLKDEIFYCQKINNRIEFNCKPILSFKREKFFELTAFVVHVGTTPDGGHYVSYVKMGDQWFYMSDAYVCAVKNELALDAAEKGYMFFSNQIVEERSRSGSDSSTGSGLSTSSELSTGDVDSDVENTPYYDAIELILDDEETDSDSDTSSGSNSPRGSISSTGSTGSTPPTSRLRLVSIVNTLLNFLR